MICNCSNLVSFFLTILGVCTVSVVREWFYVEHNQDGRWSFFSVVPLLDYNRRPQKQQHNHNNSSSTFNHHHGMTTTTTRTSTITTTILSSNSSETLSSFSSSVALSSPWQQTKRPLCTREQVIQGSWQKTFLKNGPLYITPTVHLRCYPREYFNQRPFPTYEWLPHDAVAAAADTSKSTSATKTCEWTPWRPTLFCKLLSHATVLIVGDSLSWEHYSSLVQLVGSGGGQDHHSLHTHQGYQHQSKLFNQVIGQAVCKDGNTRIMYKRDDRLQNVRQALQQAMMTPAAAMTETQTAIVSSSTIRKTDSSTRKQQQQDVIVPGMPPTVLILNRGAHYVNDTVFMEELESNVWSQLDEWQAACHFHQVKCHLVWRTSVPGHPQCWNFTQPWNDLDRVEEWIQNLSNYNEKTINYHWYDYQHQNQLVLKHLFDEKRQKRKENNDDVIILDAYYLNVLRPDEHRAHQGDCLHNCYPSKMDVYSQLLLHSLRQSRTYEHIQQQVRVAKENQWLQQFIHVTTVYNRTATMEALEAEKEEEEHKKHPL